jgi:tetratricopeptide (TPR) repeat protein
MTCPHRLLLGGVILLGTALRLYLLGADSLWGDEINTAVLFVRVPIPYIVTHFHPNNHTLFSLLAHLFTLGGSNELLLRIPAAMLGIATIPALYQLGRVMFTADTGMVAAFLLAISPYHIWFSQEARGYTGMVLFSVLSILFFFRALKVGRRWHFAGFILATALALYTHLFTILLVGAELCILAGYLLVKILTKRRNRRETFSILRSWTITLLVLGLLVAVLDAPLWLALLGVIDQTYAGDYATSLGYATDWSLDFASQAKLLRSYGGSLFAHRYGVATVSLVLFLLGLVTSLGQRRQSALALVSVLVLPFLLVAAITMLWTGFYVYSRFFFFLLPVYLLFTAYGIVAVGRFALYAVGRWFEAHVPAVVASCLFALALLGIPTMSALRQVYGPERQDWRGVGDYLWENASPGDLVIQVWHLQPNSLGWYFDPDDQDIKVQMARELRTESIDLSPGSQVWWVFVHNGQIERLSQELGEAFEVETLFGLTILSQDDGLASSEEALDATVTLIELQGEFSPADRHIYQTLADDLLKSGGSDLAHFYVERGDAESAQNAWHAAAMSFERATRIWPNWGLAHTKLGNAYRNLGRLDDAEESYRRSMEVSPDYIGAHIRLGNIYEARGEMEEALLSYQIAVETAPDSAWAQSALGSYYLRSDKPLQALSNLERAVVLEPDNVAWLMTLANAYGKLGMYDKAVTAYEQVLTLDPDNPSASEALENLEQ